MVCVDQKQYVPGMISGHMQVEAPAEADRFAARELALEAARDRYRQPMLLAWFDAVTGRYSPEVTCCQLDKPSWVVYAETRGAELAVEVGDGDFFFLFREGAVN